MNERNLCNFSAPSSRLKYPIHYKYSLEAVVVDEINQKKRTEGSGKNEGEEKEWVKKINFLDSHNIN